jgi:hypothetical protein
MPVSPKNYPTRFAKVVVWERERAGAKWGAPLVLAVFAPGSVGQHCHPGRRARVF